MKITTALVIIVLLMAFFGSLECANKKAVDNDYRIAINAKGGLSVFNIDKNKETNPAISPTYGFEAIRYFGQSMLSISFVRMEELRFFNPTYASMNHLSVMVGRHTELWIFMFQFQAGFSINNGREKGEVLKSSLFESYHIMEEHSNVGLPIKLGIKLVLSDNWRIGLDCQTNINNYHIMFAPLFSLEYGKIR